jgi:transposase
MKDGTMKKYRVTLTEGERKELKAFLAKSKGNTKSGRARILLGADDGEAGKKMTDREMSLAYDVSISTIERTRQRFVEDGFELAFHGKPRPLNVPIKMDGELEAHLIATACSEVPDGYSKWTVRLLTEALKNKGHVVEISEETVRLTLKKTKSSPGKKSIT